ncbi:tRNA (cytidine(34)-2'-O)-methyltransferase [Prochlorococcus sp. MIT 1341]|uniref:tRNA (cytidine(34)-2'-O)-methyltransferase n=1 Tax=Prochlorococcus sp. MIT 1341 TaxID=3096221 RepID=UPI002A756506|nr:tRNA (cytidine(34)-2'-O)-methyltransferase [Prochlorococcus sp. MIT 1341]
MLNNYPLTVALYQPCIPQNTGNIARSCAAFKIPLVLIKPLGFSLSDKHLRRAGLDYWPLVEIIIKDNFSSFIESVSPQQRIIGASSHGGIALANMSFNKGDILLFGREDTGLPSEVRNRCDQITCIEMPGKTPQTIKGGVRSLNLSVACAVISYKAASSLHLF